MLVQSLGKGLLRQHPANWCTGQPANAYQKIYFRWPPTLTVTCFLVECAVYELFRTCHCWLVVR